MNVSKTTVHRNMQKMKFSYITPRSIQNEQDKSKQKELKKT
ncbi:winged helix-turn-helix domain-containing protein [Wolbachia endosymbiont of Litomosoides sigmodontis]